MQVRLFNILNGFERIPNLPLYLHLAGPVYGVAAEGDDRSIRCGLGSQLC